MPRATRLILGALLAAIALASTPPATALTPGATIDVVIDELTPMIPRPGGVLTITGRLLNSSSSAIDDVSVRLRTSGEPLRERSAIDEIADAELAPDAPYDNRYYDATRIAIGPLAAGEQANFTIRTPLKSLRLPRPGTYTLSVEALGRTAGVEEFEERHGIQRTFLPWLPDPVDPIGMTWLWPLADWPARDAEGTFLDERTPVALAPGGRLHELVSTAAAVPDTVTWVIDPELLQAANAIARGYRVVRDGEPVVGDQSADAKAWLTMLRSALTDHTAHVLPYADVDAGAMRRAGLEADVTRSVTLAPAVAEQVVTTKVDGGLAWAPSGRFDKPTANLLATAGVDMVVLDAAALPPTDAADRAQTASGVAEYGTASGAITALLIDAGLQASLGLPQATAADSLAARQRFLAHTAIIATQSDAEPGRVIVAAPPALRWHPDAKLAAELLRATRAAPWLHPASLAELRSAPRVARTRLAYGDPARKAELSTRYVARVVKGQERLNGLVSVLVDPAEVGTAYGSALLRAESSAWRTEPKTGEALLSTVNAGINARASAVQALSSGTVTFSGDSGRVPVTIANDGPSAVRLGVQLIGVPPTRLDSAAHAPIEIAPGHKASLDLQARVIGGDPLPVRVQLLTPEGRPFGQPEQITLGSTAYARAAAWVVGLAFAAIAVFVVVGITRRILKVRRAAASSSGSGTVAP